jgi:MOSC domain-containing protein YiiM
MTDRARVHQISVNPDGGVPKHATPRAAVSPAGVFGDRQRNLKFHGGPDRAVCLFSMERIEALCGEGHPIAPGTTGENLTIAGLDWNGVVPGARLRVGDAVELEITAYTVPCQNIAGSFAGRSFKRISQALHPGWSRTYARVLRGGVVSEGDAVVLTPPGDDAADTRRGGR